MYDLSTTIQDKKVEAELLKISLALKGPIQLTVMYAAPDKPRDGWVVFADGTSWDPGAGVGVYVYSAGAWVKL